MRVFKPLVVLLIVAAAFLAWRAFARPAPLWTERRGQLEALMVADAVTADRASWHDWSSRAFVPRTALDAVGQQYVGTIFSTPLGDADSSGRYEGAFELTLDSFELTSADVWLEGALGVTIRFVPDRAHREWSNVAARVIVRGMVVPHRRVDQHFYVRVVPIELAPRLSWRHWKLPVPEESLAARAIGSGAVMAFTDTLLMPVPLPESPRLSTRIAWNTTTAFPGGGRTQVVVNYAGIDTTLPLPFDVAVPTGDGLWLIARQAGAPPLTLPRLTGDDAGAQRIDRLQQTLTPRLKEWTTPSTGSIDVSVAMLQDVTKTLLPPGVPIELQITTDKAEGDIGNIENVRSEFVDRASLKLRPNGPTFARGTLTITPAAPAFSARALTVPVAATLDATAALTLHQRPTLVTRGDGIGLNFDAHGSSTTTLDATLTGEVRNVPQGRAALVQPALPCQLVQIDIITEVDVLGRTQTLGLRRLQHVGGDRMQPIVLVDEQPRFVELQPASEAERDKSSTSKVKWPAERLVFTFSPGDVSLGATGLAASASVSVSRDLEPRASEAHKKRLAEIDAARGALRHALKETAPQSRCLEPEGTALVANGFELGPNNDGVVFAQQFSSLVASTGAQAARRTGQWFRDAVARPTNPPPPPP